MSRGILLVCQLIVVVNVAGLADAQDLRWPAPGEQVEVQLHDGRKLRGVVTSETTESSLTLARDNRGLVLESTLPRSKVRAIAKGSVEELGMAEHALSADLPRSTGLTSSRTRRTSGPRIQSLVIRARLANWDRDIEVDGLLVEIMPLDAAGNFAPVAGQLDLELYGERHQRGAYIFEDRDPFTLLDRSSSALRQTEAGGDSFVVKLPFRRFHPDRNLEISPFALVKARLSIPEQGVFEATDDWTIVRDSSRFRDNVQQLTGSRSLAQERTIVQPLFDVRRVSP